MQASTSTSGQQPLPAGPEDTAGRKVVCSPSPWEALAGHEEYCSINIQSLTKKPP